MNIDEEILIEDKYGRGRNINDLLRISSDENYEKIQNSDFLEKYQNDSKSLSFANTETPLKKEKKIHSIEDKVSNQKKISYIFGIVLSVLLITLFNVIIILIKGDIRNTVLGAFRIPVEVLIFLILSLYIVRGKKQIPKISGIICSISGFFSGVFISFFKVFYFRELWTIFNTITESLFLLLLGLVLGLVFGGLFYSVNTSLKQKYGSVK